LVNIAEDWTEIPAFHLPSAPAQFLQFIETRAALPDVHEEHGRLRITGLSCKSRKYFAAWAAAAHSLPIGRWEQNAPQWSATNR
jgi:hypothetical protein